MFTGIITEVGVVQHVDQLPDARRLSVHATAPFMASVRPGDSIAVDGVCLTVVESAPLAFTVQAIGTTLSRTTIAEFAPGRPVNLEQALPLGDRLGGHLVQGHIDGTAEVLSIVHEGGQVLLDIELPAAVAEVTVLHGSITVDGVSLTVNALPSRDAAQVALIPYTWEHTNLGRLAAGERVNVEGDLVGRFVVHYLARRGV
ncbi:MAG TPA: riboflavin synthase [Longimicrobiales bacterium]|nr:riboflavin synthase [Longimicrobiales bacterium]